MAIATTSPTATTPALIEFSQLESWLASSGALQLPLHQIELQQHAKGREVQRLLLQAFDLLPHKLNEVEFLRITVLHSAFFLD